MARVWVSLSCVNFFTPTTSGHSLTGPGRHERAHSSPRVLTYFQVTWGWMQSVPSHESLLSTLPPNYIFFSSSFTPLLPFHICGAGRVDGLPLIAWLQLWLNGDDVSRRRVEGGRRWGMHTAYQAGTHRRAVHKKRHGCVGGWENPAQHGTPEIRRYWMRQHRGLCYSSKRSSAPVNLTVIVQIISQIITGFDASIWCVARI